MPTYSSGILYSDQQVGVEEDVSEDMMILAPALTPYLNVTGFPGTGQAKSAIAHVYHDDALVPIRTTVGTTFSSGALSAIFAEAIFKPGQRVSCQGEIMLLGASSDNKTFVITRSVGTIAAAQHVAGVPVLLNAGLPVPGAAAGNADVSEEPREVTTYVQEWERIVEVGYLADKSVLHARPGSSFDQRAVKMLRDLKLEAEQSGLKGVKRAPTGSDGTGGAMDGFVERVNGTNTVAMSGSDFTQATFRTMVEAIADFYDPDVGINAVLMCPIRQTFVFNDWQQAHVVIPPGDPLVQTYGTNVKRLQFGTVTIDVIGSNKFYDDSVFVQPQFIKWVPYLPIIFEMLAKDGRRKRGMFSGASTQELFVPEAHYNITGLATS